MLRTGLLVTSQKLRRVARQHIHDAINSSNFVATIGS